jgi:hypothetical protein
MSQARADCRKGSPRASRPQTCRSIGMLRDCGRRSIKRTAPSARTIADAGNPDVSFQSGDRSVRFVLVLPSERFSERSVRGMWPMQRCGSQTLHLESGAKPSSVWNAGLTMPIGKATITPKPGASKDSHETFSEGFSRPDSVLGVGRNGMVLATLGKRRRTRGVVSSVPFLSQSPDPRALPSHARLGRTRCLSTDRCLGRTSTLSLRACRSS